MSIATEIQRLQRAKADIAEAIVAKGGEVSGTLDTYAQAIEALPSGGGDYLQATLDRTITNIDMSDWNVTTIISGLFQNCTQLADVKLPNVCEMLDTSCLRNCAYTSITLPATLREIRVYSLLTNTCKTIISYAVVPPTLTGGGLSGAVTAIYVPDESVDAYKAATQWSGYKSKIFPLSELPQ